MRTLLLLGLLVSLLLPAQEPTLAATEKLFQESLTGGNSGELKQDRYVIEKISKAAGNLWKFEVRIQYNGKDMAVALPVPILWAGGNGRGGKMFGAIRKNTAPQP